MALKEGRRGRDIVFQLGHSSESLLGIPFLTPCLYSPSFSTPLISHVSQVCINVHSCMKTANLLLCTFGELANTLQMKPCTGAVELNLATDTHIEITPITKMLVQRIVSQQKQSLQSNGGEKTNEALWRKGLKTVETMVYGHIKHNCDPSTIQRKKFHGHRTPYCRQV